MNHVEAEATGALERYLLGDMQEPEQTDFEAHYFECGPCAEEVRVSTTFLANLRSVCKKGDFVQGAPVVAMPRRVWREAMGIAAAALLALGLGYQSFVQIPALRSQLRAANAADSPPTFYLAETRSEGDALELPRGARHFSLMLTQTPDRVYPFYDCDLLDEGGRIVRHFRVRVATDREDWQLRLPAEGLTGQEYTLKVKGASAADGPDLGPVAEYHFRLRFR